MLAGSDPDTCAPWPRKSSATLEPRLPIVEEELKASSSPKDPNDEKNVILGTPRRHRRRRRGRSLRSREVFRMYLRFAEQHAKRGRVEVLSQTDSGIGNGLKDVTAIIEGDNVYSQLKYESGVHRVQRVPATETQGRVHGPPPSPSPSSPKPEEVDINWIEAKDLRIDTFCSSGPGGQVRQHQTYSAVLHHPPSHQHRRCSCQDEKSQIKNLAKRECASSVPASTKCEAERIHQLQAK